MVGVGIVAGTLVGAGIMEASFALRFTTIFMEEAMPTTDTMLHATTTLEQEILLYILAIDIPTMGEQTSLLVLDPQAQQQTEVAPLIAYNKVP